MSDPLVFEPYAVAQDEIQYFRENGHICLQEIVDSNYVQVNRDHINAATKQQGGTDIPLEQRDTYGKAFQQHMNLWEIDDRVRQFVMNPRFGQIAADLLGVDGVRLYHDQALFKEPGGGPTPWHQDQYYWPIDTNDTITMWMPLVDIAEDMGMLTFASRSHVNGYLGTLPISDESDEVFSKFIADNGMEVVRQQTMRAGDATFHRGWNLHSAPGNFSNTMREVITIIWVADGGRVTEPVNENQTNDLQRWMPGLAPGDLVASKLNPIAYQSSDKA